MSVLVTGAAGFIGSQVARSLLARGEEVVGVDNFSPYYDPVLKFARLKPLKDNKAFTFLEADIADRDATIEGRECCDHHGGRITLHKHRIGLLCYKHCINR